MDNIVEEEAGGKVGHMLGDEAGNKTGNKDTGRQEWETAGDKVETQWETKQGRSGAN